MSDAVTHIMHTSIQKCECLAIVDYINHKKLNLICIMWMTEPGSSQVRNLNWMIDHMIIECAQSVHSFQLHYFRSFLFDPDRHSMISEKFQFYYSFSSLYFRCIFHFCSNSVNPLSKRIDDVPIISWFSIHMYI